MQCALIATAKWKLEKQTGQLNFYLAEEQLYHTK